MSEIALELDSIGIETEMKQSYLDYAMSVIVGRALPDVRDGLKPVHRRVLYAMRELGNSWNSPYKKSARIVGDVIGKYHPHGDTAVYDTMVRMAQPFSMRYMLVDGQGNFGSVDGDPPAAMRYTEVRMAKIAHEMLADLEKETVDFVPNYDESESEPAVLPTKIPALLVNGSSGIAVGMATNIPPHNLTEILNACIAIIDNPDVTTHELMEYVPGPDFPTSGIINGARGIAEAYQTGRGRVHIRARADIETNEATGQQSIVVKELPYQVNKARLLEKIAELVKDKKIEGISALRDESDKDGMRMVIVLKRGEVPEVVLNNLYQQTQMQTVFGINMVAIVDGQPRTLNLKEILDAFIRHRREVVTRRSIYDLRKARERAHVLEGLATALANIDEVIELIKASPNPAEAKEALVSKGWASGMILEMLGAAGAAASRPEDLADEFGLVDNLYYLSPVQAQAILDMRLHRLTGLEQDKILQEYREVLDVIAELLAILSDPDNLMAVIREELVAINAEYGDERRTEILANHLDLTLEDLITEEEMVVTLSHAGYAKTQQLDTYQAQKRGGKGKAATAMKDEDFIEHLFIANTHDTLLCFSSAGKVYWKKVYELPQGSRASRGKPIINLLPLEEGEKINAVLPIREFEADKFIFMATASGTVKKTPLVDYSRPRANGIIAVDLKEGDQLIDVAVTDGHSDVMLFSNTGKVIRFAETDVRSMGRVSRGVRGMRIAEDEKIISLIIAEEEGAILTATEFGYGKRTNLAEYRVQGRGGQGIISIQTSARNGNVVGAVQVCDENQIMLITNGGTLVRTPVKDVSLVGRNTQGVRLINLSNGEKLVGLERVIEDEDEDVDLAIDNADDTDETIEE
ncbi:MAG: DNA gyrase subunit A [Pseudomonadota bacterium]|jgi:DNA gyrase subunit A|uniref:DNA gyrase subunit A n=3 Tax=Methylophaga TaxID=40222 RepID=F5T042_9GAMM|nr:MULTISPECIES: DNA gyrase subunit A [Methylophaga]MEC9412534.1 DNA gyrase subunit A [Pseudomonadota bacterium]EGL54999.1 type IIA topoisomerase, A subunit [Methylophaga aminisulfidivorans MP]GLP99414.1 DNA gyrase subunit A [Methylophaga thalassica]HIC47741.1 DNA gyrase subunit A [Methylophaga sp.]HIM39759.1 DNA gyrase subunit A [Methylophaga aminisulfidivorans]